MLAARDGSCSGRHAHDIYSSITSALTVLVRHRHHYMLRVLPQLAILLSQLVAVFRQPSSRRSNVPKSNERSGLPPWLNIYTNSLGLKQARSLGRLCSAITSRPLSNKTDMGSHQTLAKSFSNHAVSVLVSYIQSLTQLDEMNTSQYDTLFVGGDAGQEIARAMFNFCDIVGTWQRNFLMDLLEDEGEKLVARELWRKYDSQRYKGV